MINSASRFLEKLDSLQKHDAFSDLRDGFFTNTLGISPQVQNAVNVAGAGVYNMLPKGGAIPPPAANLGPNSQVVSTAPTFMDKILAPKIGGVPIVPVVVFGLVLVLALKKRG